MPKTHDMEIPEPRGNPHLLGYEPVEQRFIEEFAQGKMHHAYLMTGAKGIGKATLAYRFARYVLSQGVPGASVPEAASFSLFGDEPKAKGPATLPQTLSMDADHPIFRRVAAGSHADLLTLTPAFDAKKNVEKTIIPVEEARKVPEFMSLTAAEGQWRVVIIDAVDQLNANAANALLKILEEPPAHAALFLVCHQLGMILPTIRSRCRLLKLNAPEAKAFGDVLGLIAPHIPNHDYAALYALSYGSPGHAIALYQEEGLKWYEGWLKAMQPAASPGARQKFADSVAYVKSPGGWAAILHAWRVALQRITRYPNGEDSAPILQNEAALLAAIAGRVTVPERAAWVEKGNALIAQTETFHLDKRQTVRMLADLTQLDMLAA